MLKKTIKYEDFDGNEREETFYFNLTEAEVTEMELSVNGGLTTVLTKIVEEKDGAKIIEMFKWFILKAYGEKSPDGKFFVKNDQVREAFANCAAYSVLFMEISTDAEAAALFVNGVLPQKLVAATKNKQ